MEEKSEFRIRIEEMLEEAMNLYDENDTGPSMDILMQAWGLLPEPKQKSWEGRLVLHDIYETYFCTGQYEKCLEWLDLYVESDTLNMNYGNSEFYAGKTMFELGRLEEAKKYFKIADKKSEGRVWRSGDAKEMKYLKFYKSK